MRARLLAITLSSSSTSTRRAVEPVIRSPSGLSCLTRYTVRASGQQDLKRNKQRVQMLQNRPSRVETATSALVLRPPQVLICRLVELTLTLFLPLCQSCTDHNDAGSNEAGRTGRR